MTLYKICQGNWTSVVKSWLIMLFIYMYEQRTLLHIRIILWEMVWFVHTYIIAHSGADCTVYIHY